MDQDQALQLLEPHFRRLAFAIVKSFETYRTRYPHRPIHQLRTAANVMNDEIWAEVVNAFDEVPRVRPVEQRGGLRLLGVAGDTGEIEILLWFKKLNRRRRPRCYPTERASQMLSGENIEMFNKATTLVVGYSLNRERNRIVRISIVKLLLNSTDWFIDLELPAEATNLVHLADKTDQTATASRVVVKTVGQRRLGNGV